MTFFKELGEVAKILHSRGVPAVTPDDLDLAAEYDSQNHYGNFKRCVSRAHINKIRDPRTIGVLVGNFDKRGISSYIGPNTFAEVAVAFADGKRIYLLNGMPSAYADELSAWGVNYLLGNLDPLIEEYYCTWSSDEKQLRLPWY